MIKQTLTALLITLSVFGMTQTATDFTAEDCNGVTHNLFSELDNGKIIVMAWVMPCFGCISPAVTARDVVQTYQTQQFKNTVYFYLVDDYGDIECSLLDEWANENSIPSSTYSLRFSNSSIDMFDYGEYGMPKVVVLGGGTNHTVFYEHNFYPDEQGVEDAIEAALLAASVKNINNELSDFSVFPNPVMNSTNVKFNLIKSSDVQIELFDLQGKKLSTVFSGNLAKGSNSIQMNVTEHESGMYLLKINSGDSSQFQNLVIAR